MAQNKLPPILHDAILQKVAEGNTTRKIAAWLKTEHGVQVTHTAVANLVRKHRNARSELAKVALVEYAASKLPADLAHADETHNRMVGLLDRAISECEVDLSTFAVDKVRKLHECVLRSDEQKRKALGLDQPEAPAITSLFDLLQGEEDEDDVSGPN